MRYSVFDSRGNWQASYSQKFPNTSVKTIKSWAIHTGKLVAGKVYERIIPNDARYKERDHLLYDFTHLKSKLVDKETRTSNKPNKESSQVGENNPDKSQ